MVGLAKRRCMADQEKIPPKYYLCQELLHRKTSLTYALRQLEIGEYKTFPLKRRRSIHSAAIYAGIKVATRQMGRRDTFRCYRVE